jgi:four helix bundle protein
MDRKHSALQLRLQVFACTCIRITDKISRNLAGQHIAGQLIRSATSPALNYGEAIAAESKKDFIHKMKICLKELHESDNCLQLIRMMQWVEGPEMNFALKEADELIAIFTASIKTAITNTQKQNLPLLK